MKLNPSDLQPSYCGSRGFANWVYTTPNTFDDVLSPNYFGRGGQSNPRRWDRIEITAEFTSDGPEIGEVIVTRSEPGWVEVKTLWRERIAAEAIDQTKGQAKITKIISAIRDFDPTDKALWEDDGRPRLGPLQRIIGPISAAERDRAWSLYKAGQPPSQAIAASASAAPKTKAA
ncbi:hypothetical protein LCGC14_2684010 [marine sediment metagenome]|uniref:Uncharacterized protein n=1 Tax=marine sediment metagenome TaxID=412755 RepID=A0A0F9BV61_9ZZZZ